MKPEMVPLSSAPPADVEDRYVGATLASRYKIVRKLAEGAQARVYVAQHTRIGRHVAIKMLLPALSNDRDLVKRFLNEGRAAGTLGHPNIVEFLDMGVAPDGLPYLVMELLEGTSLAYEISRNGPFAPGRAAYVAAQIASAVSLANQRGIIHRDLKPENVFLVEGPERPDHVKVLDFGISKIAGAGTFIGTAQGRVLGTPGFMAPEQVESPGSVDERADVYGLGATLYDMLAGAPPFVETDFVRMLRVITEENPRRLSERRADLPPGLVAVVERAMSKAPAERYQTMYELYQALAPFIVEPQRRNSDPTSGSRIPFAPLPPSMLLIDEPTPMPLPLVTPKANPPSARRLSIAPPISQEASRDLLARASRESLIPNLTPPSGRPAPPRMRPVPAASAYWLHTIVVGVVTAIVGIVGLRLSSTSHDAPTLSAAPEPQAAPEAQATADAPGPTTQAAAETARAPHPTVEAGRVTAEARTAALAPPAQPAKARAASHPRSAAPPPAITHPRSAAPPAAAPPVAAPQPAQPATNCDPPYYFEGTKKLYKPGCL